MSQTIFEFLQAGAAHRGEKPALIKPDGRFIKYDTLFEHAGRYAALLAAMGIKPGERVAVQLEKSSAAIALYLGCLSAGVVYLPLNTAYTPAEIGYFLEDSEAALLVCEPDRRAEMAAVAKCRVETLHGYAERDDEGSLVEALNNILSPAAPVRRRPDDLACLCYTSGTTGRSKGAMLTNEAMVVNAKDLIEAFGIGEQDVLLHALPIFHIHGLFVAFHTVLARGGTQIFLPRFEMEQVLAWLPKASVMMGVPTFYTRLVKEPGLTQESVAGMRLFVSGSAPLLAETHEAFAEKTGHRILERYGMTETGILTANPLEGERRPGTVGFPLRHVDLRVADAAGQALPQGETGAVEVKGPGIFPGYWRRPERRAEDFREDGYFITGDVGQIDADGYLHLVGRAKDLVITGGYNVYPKEIELVIDALPGILESAVIGLPHPDFGEGVTAVIVADGAAPDEAAVIAACKAELAAYKVPKRVLTLAELPRNAMGKVQKATLRQDYKDLYRD